MSLNKNRTEIIQKMSKSNSIIVRIKIMICVNNLKIIIRVNILNNPEEDHSGRNVFGNHDENISRNT